MKETELNYEIKNVSHVFNTHTLQTMKILFYVNTYMHEIFEFVGFLYVGFREMSNRSKPKFFPAYIHNSHQYVQVVHK